MADNAVDLEPTVLLNISDMIDLAIGTPEVGVVDFNMLQSVLHVLAQQMRVLGKNVELRGSAAQLPVTSGRDNVQTVAITEYLMETDETKQEPDKPKLVKVDGAYPSGSPDTLLVVERVKKSDSRMALLKAAGIDAESATPTPMAGVGPVGGGPDKVSLVTISKFTLLENTVKDLKQRVYGSMPKNEAILEEVRSQSNMRSITDMWTSLNVSSRLEAAEEGLAKLSSLVQDLIGGEKRAGGVGGGGGGVGGEGGAGGGVIPTANDMADVNAILQSLRHDLDELTATLYAALEEQGMEIPVNQPLSVMYATTDGGPGGGAAVGQSADGTSGGATPTPSPAQTDSRKGGGTNIGSQTQKPGIKRPSFSSGGVGTRLSELEKKLSECCQARDRANDDMKTELSSFQDQIQYLSKQVANVASTLATTDLGEHVANIEGLSQIFGTVQEMQEQLKEVHDTASRLAIEKEERQQHMNALLEQIEILKTIKLDREDMVEAMAEKADVGLLARKVSHDKFEMACDDLTKGVERALGKLTMQEALWQQALDDIQREIEMKLDKMELSPVKDFFNKKLKQLQDNLKQMADLRREVEAAGTKQRLLRDVNCISCDAKTVMAMEAPSSIPTMKPMPPSLSMKPYLSYELDTIRKQQASNVPQRNMHDWENIDKQMQPTKQLVKTRTDSDKHLCNRYCGGSHTVTTASQRVVRLGHFLKQWGPDVLPLSSGMAAGDDGKMYKISTDPPAGPVETAPPTPKSPGKKEPCTRPSIPVKPECRCLEAAESKP